MHHTNLQNTLFLPRNAGFFGKDEVDMQGSDDKQVFCGVDFQGLAAI